jgi:hypothetical protein
MDVLNAVLVGAEFNAMLFPRTIACSGTARNAPIVSRSVRR